MLALCAISLLRIFSLDVDRGDTTLISGWGDGRDERPTDTVFIRAQRVDFATVGRVVKQFQSGDNDQLLTAAMQDGGAFFKQYGVTGSSTISRRGADANQTQINWNGLPINNPMLGMSDFNTLMSWGTGEMFLVEGGNSAVVGSGSMGGTLFMRNGLQFLEGGHVTNSEVQSKAMLTAGSFGERNLAAHVKMLGKRTFASFDVANFTHKNAFVFNDLGLELPKRKMENALRTQQMMRVVSGMKWKRSQLRGVVEFAGMSRQLGLAMGSLQPLGKQLDLNLRGLLEHQVTFKGHLSMLQRLGGVMDQIDYYSTPNDTLGSLSRGKTLHYQNEIYYTRKSVRFLLGTDFQYQRANTEYYLGWARRVLPASLVGLYWSDRKWSAVGNARYEWNERMPTAGLSLQFQASRRLAWKSNVHSSFRRPTLNDLFWVSGAALSPLKSEKGWGSELGLMAKTDLTTYKQCQLQFTAEITAYYRELDFPILWVPAGAVWRATNLSGGGRYAGAQLSVQAQAHIRQSKMGLQINLDRVKALVKQAEGGPEYQQIFVPLYNGNIALSWHRPKYQFSVNTQLVGLRYIQTDNLASLPAYALVNAQWRYPAVLTKKGVVFDVGLQTQNLTQTSYFSMPGRPMPGRSVQFTLWIQTVSKSHAKTVN
jgi:vitamin B12 transporter